MKWERNSLPFVPGYYRVLIAGDSESIDGHQIYSFRDYEIFCELVSIDIEDNYHQWDFPHDEEEDFILAWFGPIEIPPCPTE